jgi:hypothetical protein
MEVLTGGEVWVGALSVVKVRRGKFNFFSPLGYDLMACYILKLSYEITFVTGNF